MSAPDLVSPGDPITEVPDAELVRFDTHDTHLGGYAWWQDGPADAVLFMHGWAQDAAYHADRARALHRAGWDVLSLASRGWPGSGGDPDDYGLNAEHDIPTAVRLLRDRGARRVLGIGFSAGGLKLVRGAPYADGLSAVVTINAPMNVHTEYRDTLSSAMREYYDRILTPAHWERCSPVTVADQIRQPLMAIAGSEDGMIPPSQAREICALVPGARYVEIPGMRHLPTDQQWDDIMALALDFVASTAETDEETQ